MLCVECSAVPDFVMTSRKSSNKVPRGERHYAAKLKDSDIKPIFELREQGLTLLKIAEKYGVSQSTVCEILLRRKWRSVEIS